LLSQAPRPNIADWQKKQQYIEQVNNTGTIKTASLILCAKQKVFIWGWRKFVQITTGYIPTGGENGSSLAQIAKDAINSSPLGMELRNMFNNCAPYIVCQTISFRLRMVKILHQSSQDTYQ
jgi:hypothetical protein